MGIDANDAGRPFNPGENFMIHKENNTLLTVEARANIMKADTIFYAFKNLRKIKYQLVFAVENFAEEGLHATLVDNYLHTKTSLSLTDSSFVDFIVDDNKASYENRFLVIFEKSTQTLPAISSIVTHTTDEISAGSISVYPNPAKDKTVDFHYTSMPVGKYNLQLISHTGQLVYKDQMIISTSKGMQIIKPGKKLASGSYRLIIIDDNGRRYNKQVIL